MVLETVNFTGYRLLRRTLYMITVLMTNADINSTIISLRNSCFEDLISRKLFMPFINDNAMPQR